MKRTIRLKESELKRMIAESIKGTLKEGRKKDPMAQWFKDFDNASKYRDNMDYITKGGRKPKHWKDSEEEMDESTLKEGRKEITPTMESRLREYVGKLGRKVKSIWEECSMYERGMNNYLADLVQNEPWVDKLWDVAKDMEEYAEAQNKKPDYGPYEGEPYHFGY